MGRGGVPSWFLWLLPRCGLPDWSWPWSVACRVRVSCRPLFAHKCVIGTVQPAEPEVVARLVAVGARCSQALGGGVSGGSTLAAVLMYPSSGRREDIVQDLVVGPTVGAYFRLVLPPSAAFVVAWPGR